MSTPYSKIHLLNVLIGHEVPKPDTEEFWNYVRNQTELVLEESQEAHDEAIDQNLEKYISEVADIMVTAIGLYQKLQLAGVPIDKVLDRVCDKNLEKFHKTAEEANETVQFYTEKSVETFVRLTVLEDGSEYYAVIRKSDGKMLKPKGFEKATFGDIMEEIAENVKNWEDSASET